MLKGAIAIILDKTEEEGSYRQRKEMDRYYQALKDNTLTCISIQQMIYDASGKPVDYRFLEINDAFERLTGIKRKNILGKLQSELSFPPVPAITPDQYQQVIETGAHQVDEQYIPSLNKYILANLFKVGNAEIGALFVDITQNKQHELYIEAERDLLNQGPTVMIKWADDADSTVLSVTGNIQNMLGYSVEIMNSGKFPYKSLICQDDLDKLNHEIKIGLQSASGSYTHSPYRLKDVQGNFHYIQDYTTIVRNDRDEIEYYLCYLTDITDQVKMQNALKFQNDRLENIIGSTQAGTWEWNVETGELEVNDRWAEIAGYTKSELEPCTFDTWKRLLHPDDQESTLESLHYHFHDRNILYDPQFRMKHKQGHWIWVQAPGHVIEWDEKGHPLKMIGIHLDITKYKEQDEKITQSERNLFTLFNTIDDLLFVLDQEGMIIGVNQAVTDKLGYNQPELIKMHVLEVHPPEFREEAAQIVADMMAGKRENCPLPLLKKDGSYLPVETKVWTGLWNGREAIYGISKDLSKVQMALDRFERLFESNPVAMALSREDTRDFTEVNQAFLKITGFTKEEVIGNTSNGLGLLVGAARWKALGDKLIRQGYMEREEASLRTKTGEIRQGMFWGNIIRNQMESLLLTSYVDMTDLKLAEKVIADKEKELELFFLQSLDGFFFMMLDEPVVWNEAADKEKILDYVFSHQRITKINDAMLDQYGRSHEEMMNLTPADIFAHDIQQGRVVWHQFFDEGVLHIETDERKADGSQVLIEGDYICLYDDEGRITGHFGIQRDITERKSAQQRLQESNQELNTALVTLETAQDALVQNERLVAVGQLSAGIAHNFNTILTGIMGTAELLKMDRYLSTRHHDLLDIIRIRQSGGKTGAANYGL